jgi:hypothetical protein
MAAVTWCAAMKIVTGVGDLWQRTGDNHTCRVLGGRVIERSGDAVCGLMHVETRSASFLIEPQNQDLQFVSGLDSKPLEQFSLV